MKLTIEEVNRRAGRGITRMSEQERAAFEKWHHERYLYKEFGHHQAWLGWQACAAQQPDWRKIREALEFYAAKDNYQCSELTWDNSTSPPRLRYPLGYPDSKVDNDRGKIACHALSLLPKESS